MGLDIAAAEGDGRMKKLVFSGMALAVMLSFGIGHAQTVGQDMKDAGHDTAHATKTVGHDTVHGTKVATSDTVHGTKVASRGTVHGTRKGYHKTTVATRKTVHRMRDRSSTAPQ